MGNKVKNDKLIQCFKGQNSFTTNDVYGFFSKTQTGIKRATVNWRIYELVRQGLLQRIGRGVYALGKGKGFIPIPHKKQKSISFLLKKQFPFITFCCWHTSVLKEFYQHVAVHDFLLVEVERDIIDSVFHFLKETNKNTLKEPSQDVIENFVFKSNDAIIVKPLISEAPLQSVDNNSIPALEKILVDLYADSEIFFFLQGNEMLNIFENAVEKYTVNTDKLLRYAKRRNKKDEIQQILERVLNQTIGKKQE
jgi:DNA-binding Lrp family transcriptional regulator